MGNWGGLIYLLLPILLLVLIVSRSRKQQREIGSVQDRVAVGALVMMTSGIYGEIVGIEDAGVIVVEVAPGVRTRWTRRAVARVMGGEDDASVPGDVSAASSNDPPARPSDPPPNDPDPPHNDIDPHAPG